MLSVAIFIPNEPERVVSAYLDGILLWIILQRCLLLGYSKADSKSNFVIDLKGNENFLPTNNNCRRDKRRVYASSELCVRRNILRRFREHFDLLRKEIRIIRMNYSLR